MEKIILDTLIVLNVIIGLMNLRNARRNLTCTEKNLDHAHKNITHAEINREAAERNYLMAKKLRAIEDQWVGLRSEVEN